MKILFIVDVREWAFDNIALHLQKILAPKYAVKIIYTQDFATYELFFQHISQQEYDVIHFFWRMYLNEVLITIANSSNKAVVKKFLSKTITTHIPDVLYITNEELLKQRKLFSFVDGYFTISQELFSLYKSKTYLKPPFNIIHDHIGLSPVKQEFSAQKQTPLKILWIGNSSAAQGNEMQDRKGLHTIINPAIAKLNQDGCVVEFKAIDAAQALKNNTSPLSHKATIQHLKNSDILLISSTHEGTPLPLIEAMASGCAVITTKVGIASEVLVGEQENFIIQRNVDEFVCAIKMLDKDRKLLTRLKTENLENYKKFFQDEITFNLWDNFIQYTVNSTKLKSLHDYKGYAYKRNIYRTCKNFYHFLKELSNKAIIYKNILKNDCKKYAKKILFYLNEKENECASFSNFCQAQRNNLIVLYPSIYKGVANSTRLLFPLNSYPHINKIDSLSIFNGYANNFALPIIKNNISAIIFSGGAKIDLALIERLRQLNYPGKIYFLWHGSPGQFSEPAHYDIFSTWSTLYQNKIINGIITLKKDNQFLLETYGVKSWLMQNPIDTFYYSKRKAPINKTEYKIGLYSAYNSWIKNIPVQLLSLTMLDQPVHLYANSLQTSIIKHDKNITIHKVNTNASKIEIERTMQQTDITLYITNSECSPMIALESLGNGVPCLVGPSSDLYHSDKILEKFLTVKRVDCPYTIAQAIKMVYENMEKIKERLDVFIVNYNKMCNNMKDKFLQDAGLLDNESKKKRNETTLERATSLIKDRL